MFIQLAQCHINWLWSTKARTSVCSTPNIRAPYSYSETVCTPVASTREIYMAKSPFRQLKLIVTLFTAPQYVFYGTWSIAAVGRVTVVHWLCNIGGPGRVRAGWGHTPCSISWCAVASSEVTARPPAVTPSKRAFPEGLIFPWGQIECLYMHCKFIGSRKQSRSDTKSLGTQRNNACNDLNVIAETNSISLFVCLVILASPYPWASFPPSSSHHSLGLPCGVLVLCDCD